jgi:hypothetical protein
MSVDLDDAKLNPKKEIFNLIWEFIKRLTTPRTRLLFYEFGKPSLLEILDWIE